MDLRSLKIALPRFPKHHKNEIRNHLNFRSQDRGFFKKWKKVYFLSPLKFDPNIPQITPISELSQVPDKQIANSLFLCYYDTDDDYVQVLRQIKDKGGHFFCFPMWGKTRYFFTNKAALLALNDTFLNRHKISHWNINIHETITQALDMTKDLPGAYVEIGVFKGGSALTALNYLKYSQIKDRPVYLLDTFEGFNYTEARKSFDIHWQDTHQLWGAKQTMKLLKEKIFNPVGVPYHLIRSNICRDQLPSEIEQIAACNIDVDIYDATLSALTKVGPLITIGGVIICEDPTSTPGLGGALVAMTEFLETELGHKFCKVFVPSQYLLIRLGL